MNEKLKIMVCYHKDWPLFKLYKDNPNIFIPIFGGKKTYNGNSEFLLNMIGDDTGKNASEYNKYLSEFSQIYWLYHNYYKIGNPEYIGIFHYRRFLLNCFNLNKNIIYVYREILKNSTSTEFFKSHNPEVFYCTKLFLDYYLKDKSEYFKNIFYESFDRKTIYYCNMFIMHKDLFFEYGKQICECIDLTIKLLSELKIDLSNSNDTRFFGFILERMTNFFIYKFEKENKAIVKPGAFHFINDDNTIIRGNFL